MRIDAIIWLRSVIDKLSWKHSVSPEEVEQIFDGSPRFRFIERGRVVNEDLYAALGQTEAGRYLTVFFLRKAENEALVVSARDMTKRERRLYAKSDKKREPIPAHFNSLEEAAEFWDSHDLGDYWDQTKEASFDVDISKRVFLAALEPELARKLSECARSQGVSTETLINVWLSEKLAQTTQLR